MMTTRELTVKFLAPAFLGDARQEGRWRTPPFKSLLRRWWRVAWVMENSVSDWKQMRDIEGDLFGHAHSGPADQSSSAAARKSKIRLRIDPWAPGSMSSLPNTRPAGAGPKTTASAVYLGYGPVKNATTLKMEHPVDAGETATLFLAFPASAEGAALLDTTLGLAHGFGTVGGRASNGWGSVFVAYRGENSPIPTAIPRIRDWQACLEEQWPHAIGADQRPLMWMTREERDDWKLVIEDLAQIRKAINSSATGQIQRQTLSQPVAGKGGRMPNQFRFKLRRTDSGYLRGLVYHMPHSPPPLKDQKRDAEKAWAKVHELLDKELKLPRTEA